MLLLSTSSSSSSPARLLSDSNGRTFTRSKHGLFCDGGDTYRTVSKILIFIGLQPPALGWRCPELSELLEIFGRLQPKSGYDLTNLKKYNVRGIVIVTIRTWQMLVSFEIVIYNCSTPDTIMLVNTRCYLYKGAPNNGCSVDDEVPWLSPSMG